MNNQVQTILKDLYKVDESLREHEQELIKIIKELLESRPDVKLDEQFVRTLRAEILERAKELKPAAARSAGFFANFFSSGKLACAVGGAVITILLVIPVMQYLNKPEALITDKGQKQALDFKSKIAKLDSNAFGMLNGPEEEEQVFAGERGIGAGGGGGGMAPVPSTEAMAVIAPEFINYNYVYKGDDLPALDPQMEVYKKVKSENAGKDLAKGLSGFDLGLIDINKFKNTDVASLNFVEDREFGYSVQFNLANNSVEINANWEKWPRPEAQCRDQACFDKFRLKITNIPADDKIIAIADNFLKAYNVDMSSYSQGEVNDYWRQNYEMATDKSRAYVPDTIPVVYSLIINGQKLHDQGGNLHGMTVSVNVRHDKVNSLYSITALNFASSNYQTETDTAKIIKIAENGGLTRIYTYPNATKTVDLELGAPTLALIMHWQHDPALGKGTELYVPAYIFPVINAPEGRISYQRNIVVPVIKEILEERESNDSFGPVIRPMPIMEAPADVEDEKVSVDSGEMPVQE